ncbi:MAG: DNA alkylation repair protein [Acidobacteriia bacterium]|nr:DNA alkylation repair protein [Terriglobia bacterium]
MKPPAYMADHVRRVIKNGASAPHSEEVQRFFKEKVASRGWYTAELRKVAYRFHRVLLNEHGLDYLVSVADQLFRGRVLEEKNMAVMLLEKSVHDFGPRQFRLFEQWLDRVSSWADHDALVYYLISPMLVDEPSRVRFAFVWARSRNRWRRRASAVALIRGARRRMFRSEIARLSEMLLNDADDMVQKGLGWLLREYAKADAANAVKLLMKLRARAPRLVLRTACETLPAETRAKVLAKAAADL